MRGLVVLSVVEQALLERSDREYVGDHPGRAADLSGRGRVRRLQVVYLLLGEGYQSDI